MKYLIVVSINEGKWNKTYTIEKETFDEVLKALEEFEYGWKVKVYKIEEEIEL